MSSLQTQNNEIRDKVLGYLYNKYQNGMFYDSTPTEDVVKEIGIAEKLVNLAYTNIIHLKNEGLIHGESVLGLRYPKWIRIEPYGIDRVERQAPEYAKLHSDIRIKILAKLYEHNFSEHIEDTILVDMQLVKELGFAESQQNLVFGDIIYLYRKRLIEGHTQIGMSYPYRIRISSYGINRVESVIDRSLAKIVESTTNAEQKQKAEEILNEVDQKTKVQKFRKFISENAEIIELVANVAKSWIMGG